MASSLLGRTYGQFGNGLPVAVALVAMAMGFNLLGLLPLQLPSLDVDVRQLPAPPLFQVHSIKLDLNLCHDGFLKSKIIMADGCHGGIPLEES